jgi:hypothetical protein
MGPRGSRSRYLGPVARRSCGAGGRPRCARAPCRPAAPAPRALRAALPNGRGGRPPGRTLRRQAAATPNPGAADPRTRSPARRVRRPPARAPACPGVRTTSVTLGQWFVTSPMPTPAGSGPAPPAGSSDRPATPGAPPTRPVPARESSAAAPCRPRRPPSATRVAPSPARTHESSTQSQRRWE